MPRLARPWPGDPRSQQRTRAASATQQLAASPLRRVRASTTLRPRRAGLLLGLFLVSLTTAGCATLGSPKLSFDRDGDGWYSTRHNQRVTLWLVEIRSLLPRPYGFVADQIAHPYSTTLDARFPPIAPMEVLEVEELISVRCVGTWRAIRSTETITFSTRVGLLSGGGATPVETLTVRWSNRDRSYNALVQDGDNLVFLTFESRVEMFADPDPIRDGSTDGDPITESEEARLAQRGLSIGDPTTSGVPATVCFTAPEWAIDPLVLRNVGTRYAAHGVRIHWFHVDEPELGIRAGLVPSVLSNERTGEISPIEPFSGHTFESVRTWAADQSAREYTYVLLTGETVDPEFPSTDVFGHAQWRVLMFTRNIVLPGGVIQWGGGSREEEFALMHLLGHASGLPHPADNDSLPAAERENSPSVMVPLVTDPEVFLETIADLDENDAFILGAELLEKFQERSLDYTEAEWDLLEIR